MRPHPARSRLVRVGTSSALACSIHTLACALHVFTCALHVSVRPTWSLCCVKVCSPRVHGFCVHVCSPCVRVCSTCVHVCYLCSRVLSVCVLSVEAGLTLVCSLAQTSPQAAGLHPPTLDTTTTWSGSDNHLAVVPPVFTPLFLLSSYKSTF